MKLLIIEVCVSRNLNKYSIKFIIESNEFLGCVLIEVKKRCLDFKLIFNDVYFKISARVQKYKNKTILKIRLSKIHRVIVSLY